MTTPSEPYQIEDVDGFIKHVLTWKKNGESPTAFRGQSYFGWPTEPKLFRKNMAIFDHEKKIVRELISTHPQEFDTDRTMFDRLVRMQHSGLPTRLLDVTFNPLVALYFATEEHREVTKDSQNLEKEVLMDGKVQALYVAEAEQRYYDSDAVSCLSNLANLTTSEKNAIFNAAEKGKEHLNDSEEIKRLLWFVRMENPHFEPKIEPGHLTSPIFVRPKMNNRKIIAQSGAFVVFGKNLSLSPSSGVKFQIFRAFVRAEAKTKLRKQLEALGVHASALFPEIDKAAGFISSRHVK